MTMQYSRFTMPAFVAVVLDTIHVPGTDLILYYPGQRLTSEQVRTLRHWGATGYTFV
jgi:hypothetical protein